MMFANQKAQIMILDVLLFLIILLLIISIEIKIFNNYFQNITYQEKNIDLLEKEYYIENYVLDCNFLGYFDQKTNKCYKNIIEVKNIEKLSKEICSLYINEKEIINKNENNITVIIKRGIIYKNKFSVLKVGFCEK
jgi:hypothetical protein